MSKISNIIMMLNLLTNGRIYSINELSKILEVTPRMIRIYKEELDKAGIFIESLRGPYGGYFLNQNVKITKPKNNPVIIEKNILNKYNIFNQAILEKRKIKINYYSFTSKTIQQRIIRPYGLILLENGWAIATYCEFACDIRLFELNRIKNIEILNISF